MIENLDKFKSSSKITTVELSSPKNVKNSNESVSDDTISKEKLAKK